MMLICSSLAASLTSLCNYPIVTGMDTQTAPSIIQIIDSYLVIIVGYVWNIPLVVALVGTGILLTILLKGIQFRGFKHAIEIVSGTSG